MKSTMQIALLLAAALSFGCADLGGLGGPKYGETEGTVVSEADRAGTITAIDIVKVDEEYKLGIGTAVGAVAGGLLGSKLGGQSSTAATAAGAAVGAAAGTVIESKMKRKDAQRVTVQMSTGGQVVIVQPVDSQLGKGMEVRVDGSGESARVVRR